VTFTLFGLYVYGAYWPKTQDWRSLFQRIAQDARPDDIFVMDSEDPYTPDYYMRRYLGKPIHFYDMKAWTADPVLGSRIWFIDSGMDVNHEALAVVDDTLIRTRRFFWEPLVADFWQMPPEASAVVFGEQLALGYLGAERIPIKRGETLTLDIWWQALRTPDFNYSASFVIPGIAQHDGNFDSGRVDAQVLPVQQWTPDVRELTIPVDTAPGEYPLLVTVYDWRDGTRLDTLPQASDNLFQLATVVIEKQ
jgi:hypothetical protein